MLDEAQIDTVIQGMADSFLGQVRAATRLAAVGDAAPGEQGWGQFLDRPGDMQVGLYGTCAGVIVISIAYGGNRVPPQVIGYLRNLWVDRGDVLTVGPRNFALTLRLAFFYLAIRLADSDNLQQIIREADNELQRRIVDDAWLAWQIDPLRRGPAADQYTTAFVILAYALASKIKGTVLPDFVVRAATRLQSRLEAMEPSDIAGTRLLLASIASALPKADLTRTTRKLISAELSRSDAYHYYSLKLIDYEHESAAGIAKRRDYSVIPSAVLEAFMADGFAATSLGKLSAASHVEWLWGRAHANANNFFSVGGVLTASKDQAWVALALHRCRNLLQANSWLNRLRRYLTEPNFVSGFALPTIALIMFGLANLAPQVALGPLARIGLLEDTTKPPAWWDSTAISLQLAGLLALTIWGQEWGSRLLRYLRSRLI